MQHRVGEQLDPRLRCSGTSRVVGRADQPKRVQRIEVSLPLDHQRRADRQRPLRDESLTQQHELDQRAACAAVPVWERVDRLELGMSDCGTNQRVSVIPIDVLDEVAEKIRNVLRRRADMARSERAGERTTADPVLPIPQPTGDRIIPHEGRMHLTQRFDRQLNARPRQVGRMLGYADVAQRLRLAVRRLFAE